MHDGSAGSAGRESFLSAAWARCDAAHALSAARSAVPAGAASASRAAQRALRQRVRFTAAWCGLGGAVIQRRADPSTNPIRALATVAPTTCAHQVGAIMSAQARIAQATPPATARPRALRVARHATEIMHLNPRPLPDAAAGARSPTTTSAFSAAHSAAAPSITATRAC